MTRRHAYIAAIALIILLTIAGCVIAFIFYPPAAGGIGVIGAAATTWAITKMLDKAVAHVPAHPNPITPEILSEAITQRARTIHRHYSERDVDGHHLIEDVTETIIEDEPPERPKNPRLSR